MFKAEWTNKDSLDLQQTCNKLATNLQPTEGDIISREGAIECIRWGESVTDVIDRIKALPSADTVPQSEQYKRGFEDAKRAFELEYARESENMRKRNAQLEVMLNAQKAISADAVPQLRQTDTLIIADALRYLAKDTERHLVDRTRADALRQQFLKYGASMCKGGDEE